MDKAKQASSFSNEDLTELLTILNIALGDADVAIAHSHDTQELDAYKQHKQMLRKWIRRFSRLIQAEGKQDRGRGEETQEEA